MVSGKVKKICALALKIKGITFNWQTKLEKLLDKEKE
jgi:hypothetical protein